MVSFTPRPLYPKRKNPLYPLVRGWMASRGSLDAAEKRKISCHCRKSNSGCPARSQSLHRLSYPGSPCIFVERRYFHVPKHDPTLKMEATCSFETFVSTYKSVRCHNSRITVCDVCFLISVFSGFKRSNHAPWQTERRKGRLLSRLYVSHLKVLII
jgi:hypothetical protein